MFPLGFDASAQGEIVVGVSPPAGVLRCSVPGKGSLTHGASHRKLIKVHYQITSFFLFWGDTRGAQALEY